jgi:hypothetical protein
MRSPLRPISNSVIVAVLVALALTGLTGCKKKEESAGKEKEAATGTSASEAGKTDTGKLAARSAEAKQNALARFRSEGLSARLGLEPITVEEIAPLIPSLTGATPIGAPSSTGGGRRVTSIQCVQGSDAEKVKAELEKKLGDLGFTSIRASAIGKQNIVNISAEKTPYRLSATVRSGPFPDCPAEQKKLKVLASYFKRIPRPVGGNPPAAPAPPAAAQ